MYHPLELYRTDLIKRALINGSFSVHMEDKISSDGGVDRMMLTGDEEKPNCEPDFYASNKTLSEYTWAYSFANSVLEQCQRKPQN